MHAMNVLPNGRDEPARDGKPNIVSDTTGQGSDEAHVETCLSESNEDGRDSGIPPVPQMLKNWA